MDLEKRFPKGQEAADVFLGQFDSVENEVTHPDPEVDAMLNRLERSLITQEREIYEKERAALQQRLKDVDRQIQHLKLKHAHINNNSRKCHILQLPVEMTNLIFAYTQGFSYSIGESLKFFEPPESHSEVIVSHVCRQWRSIALDYAVLWTRFRFDAAHAKCVPLERFEAYMQRSKRRPVELYLKFDGYGEVSEDSYSEELLVLLESTMKYTERWKLFFVMADEESLPLLTTLEALEKPSVPNLEYFFFLSGKDSSNYEEDLSQTIFMNGAPKLKSVLFDLSLAVGLVPPLQNIATLCLEDHSWRLRSIGEPLAWETFVQVLSLPCLTNLSLWGPLVEEPPVNMDEPFEMKRLENLRFGWADYFFLFLPYLTAPALKTLTVALHKHDVAEDIPEPTVFASLESLYLINNRYTASAWRHLAKQTKTIKSLALIDHEYDNDCFAFLRSGEDFWSNLESITLAIIDLADRENEVHDLFISRRNPNLRLGILPHIFEKWTSISPDDQLSARLFLANQDGFQVSPAVWANYHSWNYLYVESEDEDEDEDEDESSAEGTSSESE